MDLNIDIINDDFVFDADAFLDFDETIKTKQAVKDEFAKVKKSKRRNFVDYQKAVALVADIGDIGADESINCIVTGKFIFGYFIEAYLVENNLVASELTISTLSYGKENIDSLKTLLEFGFCKSLSLIVSDYFFSHERKTGIEYTIAELAEFDFRMASIRTHTKICLIKTECGKALVLQGSANLRSSGNFEQFTIDNSLQLYEFYQKWHDNIFVDYALKHKKLNKD